MSVDVGKNNSPVPVICQDLEHEEEDSNICHSFAEEEKRESTLILEEHSVRSSGPREQIMVTRQFENSNREVQESGNLKKKNKVVTLKTKDRESDSLENSPAQGFSRAFPYFRTGMSTIWKPRRPAMRPRRQEHLPVRNSRPLPGARRVVPEYPKKLLRPVNGPPCPVHRRFLSSCILGANLLEPEQCCQYL